MGNRAGLIRIERHAERIDAGGLEPLLRPEGKVAAGGLFQVAQQIIKGGIAPCMGGEVAAHTGEEVVAADISLQLLEHRSALGIGDAIEVLLHRFDIAGVGGNRVGGRQLILLIGPGFFHIGKGHPRGIVFGFLRLGDGGGPGGEGLIEPQIVPPLHGDQVTEPHMGQLV